MIESIETTLQSIEKAIAKTENVIQLAKVCLKTTPFKEYEAGFEQQGDDAKVTLEDLQGQLATFKEGYEQELNQL